jgi:cytochrome c biogenesis protein
MFNLLMLAITSIIGTVLQQDASPEEYIREYGQANYELFQTLQFTDMYHSWWFVGLLGLFSVNLICCSIKHFPRVWKFVVDPMLVASDATLKNSANIAEFTTTESAKTLTPRLSETLKSTFANPTLTEADGKQNLFAQKGIYSRFGAYMTHLSILIIMLGAIIGTIWGYKAYVNIAEGTEVSQVWPRSGNQPIELGYSVRCDNFEVEYYQGTQRPKEFRSLLTVKENGKVIIDKQKVIVNQPLTYKGITFYQSSYGAAGDSTFQVEVKVKETGEILKLNASQGKHVALPGGYSFAITNFTPSYDNFGPAAELHVDTLDGKHGNRFVILQNHPQFDERRGGNFSFALKGYKQPQYTGLQVAKDPGVWTVWTGCFLMIFGSMSAFFFSHRRIWIRISEEDGKTLVQMAASAHRNQPAFADKFAEYKQQIADTIENKA